MQQMGVIRKVEKPTAWCHPIVPVKKPNGDLRICIDLTKLNTASKRQFYQLESVDETLVKLGKECVYMSKLDANSGYWQTQMDEETPVGRFCPTRGPFGLNSLPEIFNKRIDKVIDGLIGVAKSTDDFLVYGKTMEDHDHRIRAVLERMKEYGVTLNINKCKFRCTKVEFLGHLI